MGVDFEPGAEFAGHRIVAPLGRGGMGVVYHAVHLGLERDVALKVIAADRAVDPGFRERFRREARSAAALDHPGVITIYEAGVIDDLPYMTMRLVRGPDLGRQLRIGGPLAPEVAAGVVALVADALETAHEAGLVHRDIKPANILLERRGRELRALLADFGLARLAEGSSALTTTGSWLGTVDYAAPETLQGAPATAAADIYALGAVLHAALTGRPPFARETAAAVIWAHAHDPPPRLAEIEHPSAAALDAVIARAMAKTPGERYADAGELADAVRAATGPPGALPLLAQPLALMGDLASEITTDPMGSGLTATERAPAGDETRPSKPQPGAAAAPVGAPDGDATVRDDGAVRPEAGDPSPPNPARTRETIPLAPAAGVTPAPEHTLPLGEASDGRATRRLPADRTARRRGLLAALGVVIAVGVVALFVVLSREQVSALEAKRLTVDPIPVAAAPVGLVTAEDGTPWVLTSDGEVGFVRPIEDDKAGDELPLDDEAYSLTGTGDDLWATTEGGVARIDAAARQVLGGPVDLETGSGGQIAAGEGALWVTDTIDNSVVQADAETARAVGDPIPVGTTLRSAIVAGEGAVWVLRADVGADTTEVVQVDPAKKEAGKWIRTGTYTDTEALAAGEGGVWSAGDEDDVTRLVRIDPASLELDSRSLTFEDGISAIAAGEGAVWVLDGQGLTVTRVDPATIKPVGQPVAVAAGGDSRLSITKDALWVLSPRRGALRITWGD